MNIYIVPVDIGDGSQLHKISAPDHIHAFTGTKTMEPGDLILFYVDNRDPHIAPGIYAWGKAVSKPYIMKNKPSEYCNNGTAVDVRIIKRTSRNHPYLDQEIVDLITKTTYRVHKIRDEKYDIVLNCLKMY